jgi:hypothetical protein
MVTAGATVIYTMRTVDAGGTESVDSNAVTVTIPGAPPPPPPPPILPPGAMTLHLDTDTPAKTVDTDPNSVELGTKVTFSVPGLVYGVRWWKPAGTTSPHVGRLWGTGSAALASAAFMGETLSGWQYVPFTAPVAVTAGTQYIAAVHTTHYAWTQNGYAAGKIRGPISAPVGAGVYCGDTSPNDTAACKPNLVWSNTDYFVDVVFVPGAVPPPPVTITIAPTSTTLLIGASQQFTATVANGAPGATWTATGGSISAAGLYVAGNVAASGYSVTARSMADTTKTATAGVTITAPPPTLTIINCANAKDAVTATNMPAGTTLTVTFAASGITRTCTTPLP